MTPGGAETKRLASFNVENLFERARVLNQDQWTEDGGNDPSRMAAGRQTRNDFAELNGILAQSVYSGTDKVRIIELLGSLGLEKSDESELVVLERNRGSLIKRAQGGGLIEVIAGGRGDWIGWLELCKEAVNEVATRNTARVLKEVNPDEVVRRAIPSPPCSATVRI